VELSLEAMGGTPAELEAVPEPEPESTEAEPRQVHLVEPEPEPEPELEPEPAMELVAEEDEVSEPGAALWVAFASTPRGYRLVELDNGHVPEVGEQVELPEVGELVVLRRGPSPLPMDERICVYLEPLVPTLV